MRKNLDFLELEAGRIIPGKTLLFFDEIQACPRAIMALRYFYEQMPELHVIAAGSMIEAFAVQSEILDSYRDDFSKYTPKMDITCLDAVFLNVAQSIGRQLKYTRLNAGHSGLPVELEFRQENLLAMYRGILAEQFVAQEMLAGKDGSGLYYWAGIDLSRRGEIRRRRKFEKPSSDARKISPLPGGNCALQRDFQKAAGAETDIHAFVLCSRGGI